MLTAPTRNWRFSASYDSFVVQQTFVLRMNICGKNRQLLVAANRYGQWLDTYPKIDYFWLMEHLDFYRDIILKLKPELEKRYLVNSIGLFGSVVRPDFSEHTSDIDILVDFKKPVGIEFIELGDYLEKILNKKVDLVSKKGIKLKYLQAIESEIIYV